MEEKLERISFVDIKEIEQSVLLMINDSTDIFVNDIRLFTMLAFVSKFAKVELTEEEMEVGKLFDSINAKIVPEFEKLMKKEKMVAIFNEVTDDIYQYCKAKQEDNRHLVSKLDRFVSLLEKVDPEQLIYIFTDLTNKIAGQETEEKAEVSASENKDDVNAVENEKMKDLINKYVKAEATTE